MPSPTVFVFELTLIKFLYKFLLLCPDVAYGKNLKQISS